MRKSGSRTKYPEDILKKAVEEYLTSDMTANEVSEKYNIPAPVISYHARKEKNNNGAKQ